MLNNNERKPKRIPLIRKIKRIFVSAKGIDPHKLYPKEYFWKCWFNEADSKGIKAIARFNQIPKRQAAHLAAEAGFKSIMGKLVKEQSDLMNTPEGRAGLQRRTRYYLELRRMCKERGWDINKIF